MTYSKLKAHLRRVKVRSIEALFQSVVKTCKMSLPDECSNFFKHAGYVAY